MPIPVLFLILLWCYLQKNSSFCLLSHLLSADGFVYKTFNSHQLGLLGLSLEVLWAPELQFKHMIWWVGFWCGWIWMIRATTTTKMVVALPPARNQQCPCVLDTWNRSLGKTPKHFLLAHGTQPDLLTIKWYHQTAEMFQGQAATATSGLLPPLRDKTDSDTSQSGKSSSCLNLSISHPWTGLSLAQQSSPLKHTDM